MENKFECPSGDFSCPYNKKGICTIDGIPWEECDDAAYYHDWDEDEEEG